MRVFLVEKDENERENLLFSYRAKEINFKVLDIGNEIVIKGICYLIVNIRYSYDMDIMKVYCKFMGEVK